MDRFNIIYVIELSHKVLTLELSGEQGQRYKS